jgi:hypothetical protein
VSCVPTQHTPFVERCGNVGLCQVPPFGGHQPAGLRRALIAATRVTS